MRRNQFIILMLTMPFWLGLAIILWDKNPLFILIPCGIVLLGFIGLGASLIYAAELRTRADWDLVIRSILHRLGFKVQPPKSLLDDIDLDDPDNWQHEHEHHEHEHPAEKGNQ